MKRSIGTTVAVLALTGMGLGTGIGAASAAEWDSGVPGQSGSRYDADGNGYPDAGRVVTGNYVEVLAYDAQGGTFSSNDFGEVGGTVDSVEDLDQATLTTCTYRVHYRGSFENDRYQDSGWISNNILCKGYEPGAYTYLMVHQSDPRYTGEGTPLWGEWEYHVNAQSGVGNVERHLPED